VDARPLRLGIERLDDRCQFFPRDHVGHLVKKQLSSGGFAILFNARFSEGLLAHSVRLRVGDAQNRIAALGRNKSEFPYVFL
jgi:hypothetical protein